MIFEDFVYVFWPDRAVHVAEAGIGYDIATLRLPGHDLGQEFIGNK
jgi:hypothetical protein